MGQMYFVHNHFFLFVFFIYKSYVKFIVLHIFLTVISITLFFFDIFVIIFMLVRLSVHYLLCFILFSTSIFIFIVNIFLYAI